MHVIAQNGILCGFKITIKIYKFRRILYRKKYTRKNINHKKTELF